MLFQIICVCNINMFHAVLYHIANKGKTKREYSNCTGNKDKAAYTQLQMTKEAASLISLYAVMALGNTKHEIFVIRQSCLTATSILLVNTCT